VTIPVVSDEELIEALLRNHGNRCATATQLGIRERQFYKRLRSIAEKGIAVPQAMTPQQRTRAIVQLTEAAHRAAPDPFEVRGVSSLINRNGEVIAQWIKTGRDQELAQIARQAAAKALAESVPPAVPLLPPLATVETLANCYVFSDYHMGMLAWHREGGADWDLAIAERTLTDCFEVMLARAPASGTGILIQLGDFLHTDGLVPITPAHHHVLDADSRFSKIVDATIRVLRRLVDRMLEKHERIEVIMGEGNHDPASSIWLGAMFRALYGNEPRVKVDDSRLPYYAIQFGKVMIAAHHGHLTPPKEMPGVLAAQFAKMWGETEFRQCHMGHRHHVDEKEYPGVLIVQHPTLAARDAYAARGGWHAVRAAKCITYDRDHGEVGRTVVTPGMVAPPVAPVGCGG
jgi:hypothetical protein